MQIEINLILEAIDISGISSTSKISKNVECIRTAKGMVAQA